MFVIKIGILSAFALVYLNFVQPEGVRESCYEPQDCGLWHFVCEDFICKCDKEHIPDHENKYCAVDIEKACGYHDTCYDPNAECVGVAIPKYGSCQCKHGYTLHASKRVCSVVMGNSCNVTNDCIEGQCASTKCTCNSPLEANKNGTKCLPALHKDCKDFKECAKENAICTKDTNLCQCNTGYEEAERNKTVFCLPDLGTECQNKTDCADTGTDCLYKYKDGNMDKKICSCGRLYVQHPSKLECLKVATHPNADCAEDIQCELYSGKGSMCTAKKCDCKQGFYLDEDFNRCVRSCVCTGYENEFKQIKGILKELQPTLTVLAANNLVNKSVLKEIQNLYT